MNRDRTVLAGWGIGFQWYAGWVVSAQLRQEGAERSRLEPGPSGA
jgi:hypothetical protein